MWRKGFRTQKPGDKSENKKKRSSGGGRGPGGGEAAKGETSIGTFAQGSRGGVGFQANRTCPPFNAVGKPRVLNPIRIFLFFISFFRKFRFADRKVNSRFPYWSENPRSPAGFSTRSEQVPGKHRLNVRCSCSAEIHDHCPPCNIRCRAMGKEIKIKTACCNRGTDG